MILKNLIYILQSEGYDIKRFLKFAYTHLTWWKLENRQKIVWTSKARAVWFISIMFFWIFAGLFLYYFSSEGLIILPFLIIAIPFIVVASLVSLSPLDLLIKAGRINSAQKIISESKVRVIGITGSYGKTSTKEILSTLLEEQFRVIKTPENLNTDIGIADFIIKNKKSFQESTIFIVEMGAYRKGDIAKICKMVNPSYSILTGINEAHLEKFGSIENTIKSKFELPQNTQLLTVLNFDDENIKNNCSKFSLKKSVSVSHDDAKNIRAKENFEGLEFEWEGVKFETSLLAEHNITLILLCARVAFKLGISPEKIREAVSKLKPIKHRLQPIFNPATGILVIDDSYNGNFNGILSGIKLLDRAPGRKIVLTPGLVELGSRAKDIHEKIADLYAKGGYLILLIKNKMTDYIIGIFKKNGFANYKVYNSTQEAHDDLKNVLKRGDTIIFQNDLTDNYF
jgi:UDP-N-acetylmuramoyl-tripeptide--D-alanyl-D-alanine ligase